MPCHAAPAPAIINYHHNKYTLFLLSFNKLKILYLDKLKSTATINPEEAH